MAEPVDFDDYDPFDPVSTAEHEHNAQDTREHQADEVLNFLRVRQGAYQRVFVGKASKEDLELVMADLVTFCRGDTTPFHQDERVHVLLTGRHEVYRRIRDHLDLSFEALARRYTQPER